MRNNKQRSSERKSPRKKTKKTGGRWGPLSTFRVPNVLKNVKSYQASVTDIAGAKSFNTENTTQCMPLKVIMGCRK